MNKTLEAYRGLIGFLGKALPEEFDAVLFDLTEKGYPVIEQSDWGNREEKELRKIVIQGIKEGRADSEGCFLDRFVASREKPMQKTSVFYVKEEGNLVGALTINSDMSAFIKLSGLLNKRITVIGEGDKPISLSFNTTPERAASEVDEIDRIIEDFGTAPEDMTPTERKEVFMDIYDTGVFKIKGAIPKAAEALRVSEQTIYRYISDIRKIRK